MEKKSLTIWTIVVVVLALVVGSASGAELLVPSQYPTIQAAIDAAADWDTVIVAPGVYGIPDANGIDFRGKAITVRSANPNDQDVVSNTIVDCLGSGRGFYFHSGENEYSVLAGLTVRNGCRDKGGAVYCEFSSPTITNCTFTGNLAWGGGGGIYASAGSVPTIMNCTIIGNTSGGSGGGIYCYSAAIKNCTISNNETGELNTCHGGGIYCASASITDCIIAQNTTGRLYDGWYVWHSRGGNGGGIYAKLGSSVTITSCTIRDNKIGHDQDGNGSNGGGIYCFSGTISNCTIIRNQAGAGGDNWDCWGGPGTNGGHGGGIYCTTAQVTNCTIAENKAGDAGEGWESGPPEDMPCGPIGSGGNGGGIYCITASITNCLLRNNHIGSSGGGAPPGEGAGVYGSNWSEIKNCTITQNNVAYNDLGSGTITNSIVWGNYGDAISGNPTVVYSDIQGGWTGEGNMNVDPCFVAGPLDYFYLSQISAGQPADSCCVDAGSESAVGLGLDDLTTRTDNVTDTGIVDMGYHYPPSEQRSLSLLDPNGSEAMVAGSTYAIRWESTGPVREVLIEYSTSTDGRWPLYGTPPAVEPANIGNTGSYRWRVPVLNSDNYLIRISDTTFTNVSDTSDSPFTIFECRLKGDLNGDCKVDFRDMAVWAGEWLACGSNPFDPDWCGN